MYVRLAFAVAAHLEPEILIVDEVLAVGDVQFQKKCLGKMEDVAEKEGRTVLFVTHNMAAVQALCNRGIVLNQGSIICSGSIEKAILHYSNSIEGIAIKDLSERFKSPPNQPALFTNVEIQSISGQPINTAVSGQSIDIVLSYKTEYPMQNIEFHLGIYNMLREKILHLGTTYSKLQVDSFPCVGKAICRIPKLPLVEGRYIINIALERSGEKLDHIIDAIEIDIQSGDFYETGKLPPVSENKFLVEYHWSLKERVLPYSGVNSNF